MRALEADQEPESDTNVKVSVDPVGKRGVPGGEVGNYEWVPVWGHELVSFEDAEDCLGARP